ncbi:MucB/RseB C-terminal domain-containing protein [Halomonas jincaotanensis]|uniref:MucB/RseB C-terminal domain-containing protein n=1 Tax=Halomonas jincaotanensis TaxID=2810616 RepID=UPI002022BDFA|nr:MucB/RseB C-terminal domain-containing protein [Halomonas jincaotanensis]
MFVAIHASAQDSPDGDRVDCRDLEAMPTPSSALEWFERSLWANNCYVFEARAVRIGFDGVRTLSLSHVVQDGIQREEITFLDGPPVAVERTGRIGRLKGADGTDASASPFDIVDHLDEFYRLQLGGQERIANRRTLRIDIDPLDGLRLGHRLWVDTDTGLPLKQVLEDETGRAIETFQFTDLVNPRLYQGELLMEIPRVSPEAAWRTGWLPEGFLPQAVETNSSRHDEDVVHRLFSDGLSTLSLFVEPLDDAIFLSPGMHRLGISYAAVRHRDLGGQRRQVVVMGELPPRVLLRVADTLQWNGDNQTNDDIRASEKVVQSD